MNVLKPDPGTGVRSSKLFVHNMQVLMAFQLQAGGEQYEVWMPPPICGGWPAGEIGASEPKY